MTKEKVMTKEINYYEKLIKIHKNAQQNICSIAAEILSKEYTKENLKEEFQEITVSYYNALVLLLNKSGKLPLDEKKIIQANILFQMKSIYRNPLFDRRFLILELCKNLKATSKETEILTYMYIEEATFKQLLNHLCIERVTLNDHLKRIVKKIYDFIEKEKSSFSYCLSLYPQFETKETEDGTKTYKNPYKTVKTFLDLF